INNSFTEHVIDSSLTGASHVFAIDFNDDSDVDVAATGYYDDNVVWYENDGSENFTKHVIDSSFDGPNEVIGIDVDGDGDIDVVSSAQVADEVAWWESDLAGIEEDEKETAEGWKCGPTIFSGSLPIGKYKDCKIYNVCGRKVEAQALSPGIYFIEIEGKIKHKICLASKIPKCIS
ncbi:unnamed protein product, partial [marine sediment metagenome]